MKIRASYITSRGRVRLNNEDSILVSNRLISESEKIFHESCEGQSFLFAVADGMGGHGNGDIASKTVISAFVGDVPKNPIEVKSRVLKAKSELENVADGLGLKKNIGTTLSGLSIFGSRCTIFHSGDSRIYRIRDNLLTKLTLDHTYVQELVDSKEILPEDMRFHPQKNILSKAVMSSRNGDEDFFEIAEENVCLGDVYLLCTDGLWETMSDEEIFASLKNPKNARIESLLAKSQERGKDNISMIILEIERI